MSGASVYIVLATFNGERFLQQQIESIQSQYLSDWVLLVSDDGSTDSTLDIVRRCIKGDRRIELLDPRLGPPGHVGNFEYLLEEVLRREGSYAFLADQDDIWEADKLSKLLDLDNTAAGQGFLAYSDLEIMDSSGRLLGSFFEAGGFVEQCDTASLLAQNSVVGCSMLVNKQLLKLALPFPRDLQNHDWWLALVASSLATLQFAPDKLVRYRQHSQNTIGVVNYRSQLFQLGRRIARQQRVFESKLIAVEELLSRLKLAQVAPPSALVAWQKHFSSVDGWALPRRLLFGSFAPKSRKLLALQLLAMSPLFRRKLS